MPETIKKSAVGFIQFADGTETITYDIRITQSKPEAKASAVSEMQLNPLSFSSKVTFDTNGCQVADLGR